MSKPGGVPERRILRDRSVQYWLVGKLHREDGPAIVSASGVERWFIDGMELTRTEFDIHSEFPSIKIARAVARYADDPVEFEATTEFVREHWGLVPEDWIVASVGKPSSG